MQNLIQVVVLPRTAKKYDKNCNACTQPLFCSLNILSSGVAVPVIVVFFYLIHCLHVADEKHAEKHV